jgi:hypothetical protein
MNNKILDKIKKLLSLATSPNENEAKLASEKAQALLLKHNLSLSELEYEESNYSKETFVEGRAKVEDKFIGSILTKYFFVTLVKSRKLGGVYILGEKTNVEIARYTQAYLSQTFKSLFKAYQKETGCPANHRQSYYYGLHKGLAEKLEAQKKAFEEQFKANNPDSNYGLVVTDKALARFVRDQFGNLSSSRSRFNNRSSEAGEAGREAGSKITINRGVSHSSNSNKVLAIGA